MYEIGIGDIVIIQEGAVYGGLYSDRGKKVPKSQFSPTTHTVTSIKTHLGEQEAHLKEINSWLNLKYLRLESSYFDVNSLEANYIKANTGMVGATPNIATVQPNIDNKSVNFPVIVVLLLLACAAFYSAIAKPKVIHLHENANPTIINPPGGTIYLYDRRNT